MNRIPNYRFRVSNAALRPLLLIVAAIPLLSWPLLRAPARAPSGAGPAQASPPRTAQPRPPQSDSESLLATADAVLKEMSRITGLPIKAPLKKEMVSRKEIEKYVVENLHTENTPQELHIQEATLQAFGLVSREFNLEKFLITFYTEQAAGFYDPQRKTMFIADWVGSDMQGLVLAHELTHALEDQSFDLEKFLRASRQDDDATSARQAVVEGHATAAMMQRLVEPLDLASLPALEPLMAGMIHQRVEEFPTFSNAPYFFRLQALFPYAEGMGFMQRGLAQGGWSKLNTLFSNPPTSTKEIFQPQVYFEHKPLSRIALPRPAPLAGVAGLSVLTENVMGELGYDALLGQFISADEAKAVTTAWLGDRYILYEDPAARRYAIVARTRWSSAESALAFFRDYHTILTKKYPEPTSDKRSATDLFIASITSGASGETGYVILLRKGDECLWVEGIPAAQTDAMLTWLRSL